MKPGGHDVPSRGGKVAAREALVAATPVTAEQVSAAVVMVMEFIGEHAREHPTDEPPKVSIAKMADDSWVASVVDWPYRRQVSAFSHSGQKALVKLAERLCETGSDPWRPMKEKKAP